MIAAAVLFAAVIDCEAYTYDANRVIGSEPLGQVVTQPIASHVELFSTEENLLMTYSINAYYAKRDSLDAFNKTKNKRGLRSTGLVIRPEIGLGYYMWPNHFFDWGGYWQWMYHQNNVLWGTLQNSFLNIGVNAGYQFTPHIYFGGGVESVIGLLKPHYHSFPGIYGRDLAVSLFAIFRWYWFNGTSSPFLELNTGMLSAIEIYHPDLNKKMGLILTPSFGWSIKNYEIKISCLFRNSYVYDNHSVSFMDEPQGSWLWDGGLRLTFGYNYMINK